MVCATAGFRKLYHEFDAAPEFLADTRFTKLILKPTGKDRTVGKQLPRMRVQFWRRSPEQIILIF